MIEPNSLARLGMGLRTSSLQLKEVDRTLAETIHSIRAFGERQGGGGSWSRIWADKWATVEEILKRIRTLLNEMDISIERGDSFSLNRAMKYWEIYQSEDRMLVDALDLVHVQVAELGPVFESEWNALAKELDPAIALMTACAHARRIKLEFLKNHSKTEVDSMVQDFLSKLPDPALLYSGDSAKYELEYRKAATQLERDQHKFLGFLDYVKSLFMWFETTEERLQKNLSAGAISK